MSELSILDKLEAPSTLHQLGVLIQSKDCNMFHPLVGIPRAYMEIPILVSKSPREAVVDVERWVYRVFRWWMKGVRSECEAALCKVVWGTFVDLRQQFAALHGDMEPLLVWRRTPEFEELPEQHGPCFEHSRRHCTECERGPISEINMRFCVPGLNIEQNRWAWDGHAERIAARWQVVAEPVL